MSRVRSNLFVIGILSLFLGLFFCLFQEINTDEETWFLQIVNRVLSGEKLYKEVFFTSTPLSVYIGALCCQFSGAELIVVRGLLALYFSLSIILSCLILKELKITTSFLLILLACFLIIHPQMTWGFPGNYPLAKVFFLACFLFAIKWINIPSLLNLIFSSFFAALAFCTQQNVGILAFLSLFTIFFVYRQKIGPQGRKISKEIMAMLISYFVTILVCLFPVFYQHAERQFLDCLLNVKTIFSMEHCHYFARPSSWDFYSAFIFAAPVFLGISFLFTKKFADRYFAIVWIFLIYSALILLPQADHMQKMIFIPMAIITLTYSYSQIREKVSKLLSKGMKYSSACWIAVGLSTSVKPPLTTLFTKKNVFSTLPHFRYIFMDTRCHKHWQGMRKQFPSFFGNKYTNTFFLSTHAGFYYLLFDLKNPSPFDYPIKSLVGRKGELEIEKEIKSKRIQNIFTDHDSWTNWTHLPPQRRLYHLEKFIKQNMDPEYVIDEGSLNKIFQVYKHNEYPSVIGFDGIRRSKIGVISAKKAPNSQSPCPDDT